MPYVSSKQGLIDYCLRRLGAPVININLDSDQIDDRFNDAFQFYRDYHVDAVEQLYIPYQLTQMDIDNAYVSVDPLITGITRIFPLSDSQASVNMFDLRYQLRLYELYDFTSASYINYTLTMQHLRTLELLFTGQNQIRFNRHMAQLYIDWDWGGEICEGQWIVYECFRMLDPDMFPEVYNDRWLKEYLTALLKRQWGENMKKFGNIQMPGGVTLNGQQIFDEAIKEIDKLEVECENRYQAPPQFIMG